MFGAMTCAQKVTTIAGTGTAGFSGDGGPGTKAQINNPYGLVVGPDGALYFCEIGNHRVRRLDLKTGVISTFAGSGRKGYAGDGGPALDADMNEPYELRFDRTGNLFIDEMQNHVIRRVDARTRVITTIAGTGAAGFSGDGGPAASAQLRQPHSIIFDAQGRLLICDIGNHRVRRVDLASGKMETWLGNGERLATPDGAPLAGTPINGPRAMAQAAGGLLYLALREGNAVYRIDPARGRYEHVAGTGISGYEGDGGPAQSAKLSGPKGIAWARGGLYLADTESHTIRRIDAAGIIRTIAGTGKRGDGPDGDPAKCALARPHGVYVADDGTVYIGDSENHRIRMVK
jgi:sugar lactone lactonase YvrE